MFGNTEVVDFVNKVPLKHEDVLTYALGFYEGGHSLLLALKRKVRAGELDMRWLERWYPPSLSLMPAKYAGETAERLNKYLSPMTDGDMSQFNGWAMGPVVASERYLSDAKTLADMLESHASRHAQPHASLRTLVDRASRRCASGLVRITRRRPGD